MSPAEYFELSYVSANISVDIFRVNIDAEDGKSKYSTGFISQSLTLTLTLTKVV
jgi:hypothetical protein